MALLFRILTQFLVFVCAVAITSVADAKAPPKAQEHMDAGLAYVDDPGGPRYEEAYREFHAAYEIYPAYQLLANIGTCALYLERDAEAIDAYERYLEKAVQKDIPVAKRTLMEKDIKTLKASLVQLNISVSPTKVTLIDERFTAKGDSVVNRYEVTDGKVVLGIHPGNHRVTAHHEGFEDQQWEIDAKPATTHTHEFRLAKKEAPLTSAPAASGAKETISKGPADDDHKTNAQGGARHSRPKQRPTPTSVYVGLGVTGIFAVAAGVGGFLAMSKRSDYVAANDGKNIEYASSLRDDMNRYLLATGIASGAAVVSAGITTYLYASRPSEDSGDDEAAWAITPILAPGHGGVFVRRNF